MNNRQAVLTYFDSHDLSYVLHEHMPVFTCEESAGLGHRGEHAKNLFLQSNEQYFLVVTLCSARVDLKELAIKVGEKRFSFASEDAMKSLLQLTPGSVSPCGLIHDIDKRATVLIDSIVTDQEVVLIHPNDNSATLELSQEMFKAFLRSTGHQYEVLSVPKK